MWRVRTDTIKSILVTLNTKNGAQRERIKTIVFDFLAIHPNDAMYRVWVVTVQFSFCKRCVEEEKSNYVTNMKNMLRMLCRERKQKQHYIFSSLLILQVVCEGRKE